MRPQRRQPARVPCPWDSPGENTGVACHFLLQCMKVKRESEVAQVVFLKVIQSCPTPSNPMDCSLPGSSVHGIFQARVLEWGAIAFSNSVWEFPFFHILDNTCYFLLLLCFLMASLTGMRWYFFMVLIFTSLMISDVEHLFVYLLAMYLTQFTKNNTNWIKNFNLRTWNYKTPERKLRGKPS